MTIALLDQNYCTISNINNNKKDYKFHYMYVPTYYIYLKWYICIYLLYHYVPTMNVIYLYTLYTVCITLTILYYAMCISQSYKIVHRTCTYSLLLLFSLVCSVQLAQILKGINKLAMLYFENCLSIDKKFSTGLIVSGQTISYLRQHAICMNWTHHKAYFFFIYG